MTAWIVGDRLCLSREPCLFYVPRLVRRHGIGVPCVRKAPALVVFVGSLSNQQGSRPTFAGHPGGGVKGREFRGGGAGAARRSCGLRSPRARRRRAWPTSRPSSASRPSESSAGSGRSSRSTTMGRIGTSASRTAPARAVSIAVCSRGASGRFSTVSVSAPSRSRRRAARVWSDPDRTDCRDDHQSQG